VRYNDAKKLKQGDKVIEKSLGYIMTVQSVEKEEEYDGWKEKKYIVINCIAENGYTMRSKHTSVNLFR